MTMRVVLADGSLLERSEEGIYFQGGITIGQEEGEELLQTGIFTQEPVAWFGAQMELQLRDNEKKGHWMDTDADFLVFRLKRDVAKLEAAVEAYKQGQTPRAANAIIKEAADVGNYAMMLADNVSKRPFKVVHRRWDRMAAEDRKKNPQQSEQ